MKDWPVDGVESVKVCPVCSSDSRRILYSNLRDHTSLCAPGEWVLQECLSCNSAYLDPRPSQDMIHLAYQVYYTHTQAARLSADRLHGLRWLQRAISNGYRNFRFGTHLQPSSILGLLVYLMPNTRALLNREFCHLPHARQAGRLLEVGFGDGHFLELAKLAGWDAIGIDPDPVLVKNASERGLSVFQGSLDAQQFIPDSFDVIIMNNVIEHLHNPTETLKICHLLLRAGGNIWIETPNIGSLGHAYFKQNWRGLEPPRHLVIFNAESLSKLLLKVGFAGVKHLPQTRVCPGFFAVSSRLERGLNPDDNSPVPFKISMISMLAQVVENLVKSRREWIAISAIKK